MMESAVVQVCAFLKSKFILVPPNNSWLISCVEYFQSQNPSCQMRNLQEFVYEQWLLADLKDISAGCLPDNCNTIDKMKLEGKYAVQINYVINIAESFYKQLQAIRRPDARGNLEVGNENLNDRGPKLKRELKMEITDGVIKVLAFEDQQINKLVEPITPGIKVVLMGPIECRKGVLLLKSFNIQVLGGEVDILIIPNAVENILARALGAEENPDPYSNLAETDLLNDDDDEALMMVAAEIDSSTSVQPRNNPNPTSWSNPNQNNARNVPNQNNARNVPNQNNARNIPNQNNARNIPNHNNVQPRQSTVIVEEMDYDFDEDEFELIAAQTASIAEKTVIKSEPKMKERPSAKTQSTLHSFLSSPKVKKEPLSGSSQTCTKPKTQVNVPIIKEEHKATQLGVQMYKSYNDGSSNANSDINKSSNNEPRSSSFSNSGSSYSDAPTELSEWRPTPTGRINIDLPNVSSLTKDKVLVDYVKDDPSFSHDLFNFDDLEALEESKDQKKQVKLDETFPPRSFPAERIVFASVIKLPQKLSVKNEKWCLSAIIQAKGIEIEVDFSPDVLDKVFGITAAEVKAKREEVRINLAVKEQINEILKASQQRIRYLKCRMVIKFTSLIAKPVVLDVIQN